MYKFHICRGSSRYAVPKTTDKGSVRSDACAREENHECKRYEMVANNSTRTNNLNDAVKLEVTMLSHSPYTANEPTAQHCGYLATRIIHPSALSLIAHRNQRNVFSNRLNIGLATKSPTAHRQAPRYKNNSTQDKSKHARCPPDCGGVLC